MNITGKNKELYKYNIYIYIYIYIVSSWFVEVEDFQFLSVFYTLEEKVNTTYYFM